jgi:hypothetical protein
MSEIRDSLRAQGYDVDEKGYDRCDGCRRRTMPGVKQCYGCWNELKLNETWAEGCA